MPVDEGSAHGGGVGRSLAGSLRRRGFVACVIMLALMTAGFYAVTWKMRLRKLPVPLRAPLAKLDKSALFPPYRFKEAFDINPEVLDTLGTDQYIQWILYDESVDEANPVRRVSLFITYYTGQPDPVPHIPEACYLGAGYLVRKSEDWTVSLPELKLEIPARLLELEKRGRLGSEQPIVAYLFGVNGQFASDRNAVRAIIGNPFEPYSYFSKVEVRFDSPTTGATPNREQARAAADRLFKKLVPVLVNNHWPDWKALHEKPATK